MPATAAPSAGTAPSRPRIDRSDVMAALGYSGLVLLLAATGVSNSGFLGEDIRWSLQVSLALLLVASASALWRRRAPVVTLVVAGPISAAEILVGGQISAFILLFEALMQPVYHGSRRLARATTAVALSVAGIGILVAVGVLGIGPYVVVLILTLTLVVAMPLLWGWEVRHNQEARRTAEALARTEHELAASRASHAVESERRRIARDLHDVIAGHLSAVTLHTNLASTLEEQQARDSSLSTARESARAALRDLRSMIGVLASEEAGALPTATLDWDSLEQRLRAGDPEARVEVDPAVSDQSRLDPSVQAALLRIASEAVTNAVRHGQAPMSLEVRMTDDEGGIASFELVNRRPATTAPGTGVGREAIAHRADAVGGHASSEPSRTGETWRVHARLPARLTDGPGGHKPGPPGPNQEIPA